MLNLSKVFPVDFVSHKLKIDADVVLPKNSYQRLMTEPQRKFLRTLLTIWRQQGSSRQYPQMP